MVSLSSLLFLSCVALTMASPFFRYVDRNREPAEPLRKGPYPMEQLGPQVSDPSYDYGAGAPGGGTDATSESGEVGAEGGTLDEDADGAGNDAAENEAADNEAAEAAGNAGLDAVETGGNSGAAPNGLAGGPGPVAKGGDKSSSSAGRNAGIAFGVIATVGLAAGIGYFVYRKRREAAYGARF